MSIKKAVLLILIGFCFMIPISHAHIETTWNVSSVFNVTGNLVTPIDLDALSFVDGIYGALNETNTTPGFDVRANFTGVPDNVISLSVRIYDEYIGNPAHVVQHQVWNFDLAQWDLINAKGEGSFEWTNSSLSLDGQYIDQGRVWGRVIHTSNGVGTHYLRADYIRLHGYVEGDVLSPWDINWLLCLIWLGLIAIGVFKENKIITMFSGFFGIILGLLLLGDSGMVSIALILLNLYLVYAGSQ